MGTRSCIIVKVRKEDIGKIKKFDKKLLPVSLDKWESKDSDGEVYMSEIGRSLCKPVAINSPYIAIYCHWDGYPSGVGAALEKNFNTYESALNLILGGSCSFIESDKVRHYANRKGEKWGYILPKQFNTKKAISEYCCGSWAEYAYLLDEESGWGYKEISGSMSSINKRGFKPLP